MFYGFRHWSGGDFATQDRPQFHKKGSFCKAKAMVITMKQQTNSETFQIIRRIFSQITGIEETELTLDTPISKQSGLNSFLVIQMICAVEDAFDIRIDNKALRSFKRAGDIVKYVEKVR